MAGRHHSTPAPHHMTLLHMTLWHKTLWRMPLWHITSWHMTGWHGTWQVWFALRSTTGGSASRGCRTTAHLPSALLSNSISSLSALSLSGLSLSPPCHDSLSPLSHESLARIPLLNALSASFVCHSLWCDTLFGVSWVLSAIWASLQSVGVVR